MHVRIIKREHRNELVCVRDDGTRTMAHLGPRLPYHDLAHYVVERQFGLRRGFYGNIAAGYSIDALGEKDVIKSLSSESWIAEILARALTSLATGSCRSDQFASLVNEELAHLGIARLNDISEAVVREMITEYRGLASRYESLSNGASIHLAFE